MDLSSNVPGWEDGRWQALPALSGSIAADVCVVGLGGSGLSAVQELLRLGRGVVGLDAGLVAGGAAGRNGGFLLAGTADFYHDARRRLGVERAGAVYRETVREIERMREAMPDLVRRSGSLRVAVDAAEEGDCAAELQALLADGLPAEAYEGPEGRGLLLPTDGSVDPLARCRRLAMQALASGARLYEQSPALSVEANRVLTPGGEVACASVIVAVDGCLERILPDLGPRVRTARLQMLATAPAGDRQFPRPVYTNYGYDYWQQLPDGRLFLGGMRDRFREEEWGMEAGPSAALQERLEHELLRVRLGVQAPVTHRWAGLVACTADRQPIFEEVRPGVIAIGAYSGTGNVLGALYGRAAAHVVAGADSPLARLLGWIRQPDAPPASFPE
jgi:glycine/D-amino acid oxidase-like deaminating enzyme